MAEEDQGISHESDTIKLKKLLWFTKHDPNTGKYVFDQEVWQAIEEIRGEVLQGPHETVYYPGAFRDVPYALSLTDASRFVFVDPAYSDPDAIKAVIKTLREMGQKTETTSNKEGYKQIQFKFNGRPRTIHLYAADAAMFVPEELMEQPADVLLLKNTYGGSDLRAPEALHTLTSAIGPSGSIISFMWGAEEEALEQIGYGEAYSKSLNSPYGFETKVRVFKRNTVVNA